MTDFNIVLEPVAVALFKDVHKDADPMLNLEYRFGADPFAASLAISAKRQADALELIAKHLAPVNVEVRELVPYGEDGWLGWLEWKGGDYPITDAPHGLDVKFRDGRVDRMDERHAALLSWEQDGGPGDIVAYRVVT